MGKPNESLFGGAAAAAAAESPEEVEAKPTTTWRGANSRSDAEGKEEVAAIEELEVVVEKLEMAEEELEMAEEEVEVSVSEAGPALGEDAGGRSLRVR